MKRNKFGILAAIALAGLMACGPIARAQTSPTPPAPGSGDNSAPRPPRGARGMQALFEKLDLTTEQKDKIKPILADQREKMMALRDDSSLSDEDRAAKRKDIVEATDAKLKDILTADQFAKYQDLRKQMMQRRRNGDGNNGNSSDSSAKPDAKQN